MYAAARTLPIAEVRAAVRDSLTAVRAAELARKEGTARLAAWKANPAEANVPALVVSRDQLQSLPPKAVESALRTDPTALPQVTGVDLGEQGYAVVKVNRVVSRSAPDAAATKQARAQYAQVWANAENNAYYGLLKDRFKVKMSAPVAAVAEPTKPVAP